MDRIYLKGVDEKSPAWAQVYDLLATMSNPTTQKENNNEH